MASGDDSPSSLHGQPWSVWAEKLGRDSPQSDEDEARKTGRRQGDTMKLQSEDMCYYGLCPVRDDFYLVVCNICNKVCTPQALQKHIETRHPPSPLPAVPEATPVSALTGGPAPPSRSKGKKNASSANPVSSASSSSKTVPDIMATKAPPASCRPRKDRHKERSNAKLPTSIPFEPPLPPPVKPPSLPPSPLFSTPPSPTPAPATCLSNITMTVNLDSSGVPTVQIHLPETEEGNSLLNDVDLLDNSVAVATDLIGTKGTSKKRKNSKTDRKCLPLKDREFDPEKHCGVWMPENGRPCTRSLTCKAHSLSLRRAVTGRSKAFDDLLATHRAAKETFGKQNNVSIPSAPTSSVASTTVLPSSSSNSSAATFTMTSPKPLKVQKVTTPKLQSHPHSLIKPSSTTLPPLHVQTSGEASDCKFSSPQATHSPLLIPMGAQERSSSPIHTTSAPPQPLASCTFGLKSCGSLWMRGPSSRSWNTIRNSLKSTFSHQPAPSQYTMSNGVLHEGKRHAELVSEDLPAEFEWKNKRWKPESNFAELESEFMPSYTNGLHLSPDPLLDPFDGLEMLEGLVGEDGVLSSDIMNFPLGFNLGLGPGGNVTFSDSGGSGGGGVLGPALTKNSMGAPAYLTTPSASSLTPTGAMAPISFPQSLGHQVFSEASSTASQELTFKWMANSPSVSGPSSSSGHVRSSQGAGPNSHAHLQLLLQSDTEHT